ncbi:MAG TPA: lyase family protein [Chthoniobacteraceae bacterium]|nr:lyase family protein [Chthoniobacteraceae bacterium]
MTTDKMTKEEYVSRRDHRAHSAGVPPDPRRRYWNQFPDKVWDHLRNRLRYCGKMDKAWTVMLYRQNLITLATARKLLTVLADSDHEVGVGGEDWIKEKLGGDEDTASAVNLGRTMQEPMARMQMRETLLDVLDLLHEVRKMTLDRAEEFADAMMSGQSHMSHAQPTTYGQYLLSVHDGFARAGEQLALAYKFNNMNSGGCGACSGTGWNVDRHLITELLGFDELIELVYDCEASQDQIPQILFAMSSLALTLNRSALDHEIWCLEEIGMMEVGPGWKGLSSFMPQKAHSGADTEMIRIACNEVFGQTMNGFFSYKGELIQDNLPVYLAPNIVFKASGQLQRALGLWLTMLPDMIVHRDRMVQIVKEGYSGAPDLAIVLIRDHQYGSRQAHRICANAIRMARERGIKPCRMTGALLDEAAAVSDEPKPHLTTAEVQECMSLDHFFEKHCNTGDPCPSETLRMIVERRKQFDASCQQQAARKRRVEEGERKLAQAIREILAE